MPRIARVVVPGVPHHVTQRGTRRFNVFCDEADRQIYLDWFRGSCRRFGLDVLAYCLMTNHVHHVAIPHHPDSIYKVFHRTHGGYTRHFNSKYGTVGHLWQARPFSCVLDESHTINAIRYVELNPVRAGIVVKASDYGWSSAAAHCGMKNDPLLRSGVSGLPAVEEWADWLDQGTAPDFARFVAFFRDCTFTGKPCGEPEFIAQVEGKIDRHFSAKKRGRKPILPGEPREY